MKNIIVEEKAFKSNTNKNISKAIKDVKSIKNITVGNTGTLKGGLKYVIMKNAFLLF